MNFSALLVTRTMMVFSTAFVLALSCTAKLLAGHRSGFSVNAWLFSTMTAAEMILVVLLLTRGYRKALIGAALTALGGLAWSLFLAGGGTCGCYGDALGHDEQVQRLFTSMLGVAAVVAWTLDRRISLRASTM